MITLKPPILGSSTVEKRTFSILHNLCHWKSNLSENGVLERDFRSSAESLACDQCTSSGRKQTLENRSLCFLGTEKISGNRKSAKLEDAIQMKNCHISVSAII